MSKGFVYVAGVQRPHAVYATEYLSKIGITDNPMAREYALRSESRQKIEMLAIFTFKEQWICEKVEKAIIDLYSHSAIDGKREWFGAPAAEIIADIESLGFLKNDHVRVL